MSHPDPAPRPALVALVRQAWAEVLDTDEDAVPLETNFFEAGGNSMLLVLLGDVLGDTAGTPLDPVELFQHSTVRAQAGLLAEVEQGAQPHA